MKFALIKNVFFQADSRRMFVPNRLDGLETLETCPSAAKPEMKDATRDGFDTDMRPAGTSG
ncbi:hypothetical protein R5H30_21465 [Sulfitobacter sp. D35]|uniref:hypothetical protein n=1 Tax=Sulfitobacter sp. D35 TaxID=3083252 RepID=UPI00296FE0F0|nr:hypothetical protein [Sulfitobacter sp. D35]MDW4500566.1 hypothetical protein [Sulfitobacter sp. D35]